jgi:gliding motility-associated-like protein
MNSTRFFLSILLFTGMSIQSKGQCTFTLGPDICQPQPINLTLTGPPGYATYAWNTGSTTQNLTITAAGTYICTVTKISGNVITNGNFNAGTTGFSSSYVPGKGGAFGILSAEGTYAVASDPTTQHDHFPFFGDHTSGTGNMMIINGDPSPNASIWCQTVPVSSNSTYNFSTWVATCVATSNAAVAQLQFSINGSLIGPVFSPPLAPGKWSQFSTTWNSGNVTSATICIVNQNTVTDGNDFAIDDIFFENVCKSSDTVNVIVPVPVKADAGPDQTICVGSAVQLNAVLGGGAMAGAWSGGTGTFQPGKNDPKAIYTPSAAELALGKVELKYTVTNGMIACLLTDEDKMTITIDKLMDVNAGPDQTICIGETIQLAGMFGGAATGGSWSGGTGTYTPSNTDPRAVYIPSAAEKVTGKVKLIYTAVNGSNTSCSGINDEMIITIDQLPTVNAGTDQVICFGNTIHLAATIGGAATDAIWSGGAGVFSPNNKTLTGTYTPTLAEINAGSLILTLTTNAPGVCPPASGSIKITIEPLAIIDAGPSQIICAGSTATLKGTVGGGATSGSWSGGAGLFTPNNNASIVTYTPTKAEEASGKMILTFTSNDPAGPCAAVTDTMSITIHQRTTANAGDAKFICEGSTIKLSGTVEGGATMGTWSGGLGTFSPNNTDLKAVYKPTPAEVAAGKVTLILTSNSTGLCPISVSEVTHTIYPNPVIEFTVDTPKACPPHCVDFTDLTTAGSTNIVKWEWDFGNGTTGTGKTPKNSCYEKPGFYDVKLTATSDKNCVSTLLKDRMIETFPKPVANFTSNPNPASVYDPVIHFYDQSISNIKTWRWNFGDGTILSPTIQHPSHEYLAEVAKEYRVQLFVTDINGCIDSIVHPVEIVPAFSFYIPNAFTPEKNDGTNDTFFGKGIGIAAYHIWIFDRWGNMVFDTSHIDEGWNGHVNHGADIAQQDVFVWKVELKDIFGKKHNYIGTVTLVK